MSFCQINNMNEVSNTRSIKCIVVWTKHSNTLSLSYNHLLNHRKKIAWDRSQRIISYKARVVVASRIKITNWNYFPMLIFNSHSLQKHFYTQLRLTIGADRFALKLFCTVILFSIYCCRRREKELPTIRIALHDFHQVQRANKIILVIK